MEPITQCGREFSTQQLEYIQSVARKFSHLSLKKLSCTLCEHFDWLTASGGLKIQACIKLLRKLEAQGFIKLPELEKIKVKKPSTPILTNKTAPPQQDVYSTLSELGEIKLVVADSTADQALWNECVQRYHYLGYKKPFGNRLRYFICAKRDILGCMLIAGAAKAITIRDDWIGWSKQERLLNLPWVVNNTRFVIFPWVNVPHLASHALGKLANQLQEDCEYYWGYSPLLLETFVDPQHYKGTCYRAANWIELGRTTGKGLKRPGTSYQTSPKMIFVYPLHKTARKQLCSLDLTQRQGEDDDRRIIE